ncbi:hypothetical protein D039_2915B, partial [Vibrio parahaemolyticus EKP-028]
EVSVSNKA